jgi:chorismate synthase
MNTFGHLYRTTLFGTSHGPFVGCMVEGLEAGRKVDLEAIQRQLDRRRPGQSLVTSQRKEDDRLEVGAGLMDGVTTGDPIVFTVRNRDAIPSHYEQFYRVPRPGHADFPALVKHRGANDLRGGGQLSGRMTLPLTISGALARQVLADRGVELYAHTLRIGPVVAPPADVDAIRRNVETNPVRCADPAAAREMEAAVEAARLDGDSLGGMVECIVTGLPVGVGEPLFASLEGHLAAVVFAIPATKGVEFGSGFAAASMRGSEHNDPFVVREGRVETEGNNAGGILGGMSTGMPVVLRIPFKPTASIAKKQRSVDLRTMEPAELEIRGRLDPCIVPRAVPVVENSLAMAILDLMMLGGFL